MGAGILSDLDNTNDLFADLLDTALSGLADGSLHEALSAVDLLRRRVTAFEVQVLGEIDVRRSFEAEGAKTAAAYAAWKLPIPADEARLMVRCSRQLRTMPLVEALFSVGAISVDGVRQLAACQTLNPDAYTEAEVDLVGMVLDLDANDSTDALKYWRQCADPDGNQKDAEKRYEKRDFNIVTAADGMELVKGQLDAITGGIVKTAWEAICTELFDADWADAKAIHGDDTAIGHLERTDAQRRADALRIMAERAAMVAPGSEEHGPRPLLTVVCGERAYLDLCETEAGTILDPHDLIRLFNRADFERVIFDGPSRVIDVGVRQRFYTGATRRAVQVRERECAHASCHDPVTRAHVHHVTEYEHGGETVQDNGTIYCAWHHRWIHRQPQPAA